MTAFCLGAGLPMLLMGLIFLPLRLRPEQPMKADPSAIDVVGYGRYRGGRHAAIPLTIGGLILTTVGVVLLLAT